MDTYLKLPFYAKGTLLLVGLYYLIDILSITQDIVLPLIFSTLIAILISNIVKYFEKKGINRVLSIVITMLIMFIVFAGLVFLVFSQASRFAESWPALVERFTVVLNQITNWVSSYFNINQQHINDWIIKTKSELINLGTSAIGQTIVIVGNWIVLVLLIPFYVFIILYYQPLLIEFIHKLFIKSNQSQVSEIIVQIKTVTQLYLKGLVLEAVIIAILEIITLFALGIDYAILLGVIGALLNMIPYIGGVVAVALPMIVALATKSSAWYAVYIMIIYYLIQLIDNNYIVPIIVSSKVKINGLFAVIVVIAGNALWGISGMFLAIPLLAIIKIIFDHIESLKPWGFVMGYTVKSGVKKKIIKNG